MRNQFKNFRRNIGSVSSGTMRPEDLIPSFVSELDSQRPRLREDIKFCTSVRKRMEADDYFDSDDAAEDLDVLFDRLDHYTLPGFYFGAHPGDGADYGYWLSETFIEDFDGLKVSDLSEVPTGYTGEVLHVNDHGNMSLYSAYRGKLAEIWALV